MMRSQRNLLEESLSRSGSHESFESVLNPSPKYFELPV